MAKMGAVNGASREPKNAKERELLLAMVGTMIMVLDTLLEPAMPDSDRLTNHKISLEKILAEFE
jgi:hypothetical protein